ncbi:MAG TPA: LacI family DNA-binding transcriptional regulator [Fervidobacterium sp.]|nr:LacI family DNA-binding transcriptional regulator [Fervidobacterium sp.]HPT54411.1 LacI family DNA-binding transcriptional regulator [Fervidobacterium sp.]HPZ17751.1 LacI family DNA-binding transcriptional regulator [Fervidobacterium sp.]HQE49062.1 LacI family DNA-binding transcriptional regulator [Fervidobacterium sp.]HUM42904.1 LacI family DNA-binding transcriptional regulator [Fervidobacterium sp.]
MVSIEDVAKYAGVSIATVSRVLNRTGYVSEETELRVLKAVNELDYKPHISARTLARKKNQQIGLVISRRIQELLGKEIGTFYKMILEAIENAAAMYKMTPRKIIFEEEEVSGCDGYIIIGSDMDEETIEEISSRSRVVLVDHYIDGLRVNSILSDGYDGVFYVTQKFIENGFNRIIHLHGPLKYYGFRDRYNGYVAAMRKNGKLPINMEYDELNEEVDNVLRKILRDHVPEVLICSNDIIAISALKKLKEWGYKIPEQINVVGFDNIPDAEKEGLSTLHVQKSELGLNAVKRLYELLNNQSSHPYKQCLYTSYVKRDSTII